MAVQGEINGALEAHRARADLRAAMVRKRERGVMGMVGSRIILFVACIRQNQIATQHGKTRFPAIKWKTKRNVSRPVQIVMTAAPAVSRASVVATTGLKAVDGSVEGDALRGRGAVAGIQGENRPKQFWGPCGVGVYTCC